MRFLGELLLLELSLELAGADTPDHAQFQSLLPVLKGEPGGYPAIYGGYLKSQRSVIADGYKLVLYPNVPKVLLFDLEKDPREMSDLSEDASQADRIKALAGKLKKLQAETGDQLDLSEAFPELF